MCMSLIWGSKKLELVVNFLSLMNTYVFWFTLPVSQAFLPIISFFGGSCSHRHVQSPFKWKSNNNNNNKRMRKYFHTPLRMTSGHSKNVLYFSSCTIGKSVCMMPFIVIWPVGPKKDKNMGMELSLQIWGKKLSSNDPKYAYVDSFLLCFISSNHTSKFRNYRSWKLQSLLYPRPVYPVGIHMRKRAMNCKGPRRLAWTDPSETQWNWPSPPH